MSALKVSPARHRVRNALIVVCALLLALGAFAGWYKLHYSMGAATAQQIAGAPGAPRVLIATQASAYKDAVTAGLITHLSRRSATIRVIDVDDLATIRPADWDAVVLLHTWEVGKPPAAVRSFIDGLVDRRRLVVLVTSGEGHQKMQGVDAVTGASQRVDVPRILADLSSRVDAVLDGGSRQ